MVTAVYTSFDLGKRPSRNILPQRELNGALRLASLYSRCKRSLCSEGIALTELAAPLPAFPRSSVPEVAIAKYGYFRRYEHDIGPARQSRSVQAVSQPRFGEMLAQEQFWASVF